jgi:hypothetical protein
MMMGLVSGEGSMLKAIAVALVIITPLTCAAAQQQAVPATSETFLGRMDEGGVLRRIHVDVGALQCTPPENGRRSCLGNMDAGSFGISVLLKTDRDSQTISTLTLAMASPQMARNSDQGRAMSAVFLACMARAVAVLQPEVPEPQRAKTIQSIVKKMGDDDDVILGKWRYSVGNSFMMTFRGERD